MSGRLVNRTLRKQFRLSGMLGNDRPRPLEGGRRDPAPAAVPRPERFQGNGEQCGAFLLR